MSAYYPDEMLVVLGFTVEITGGAAESDSRWLTVSGGGIRIHEDSASPVRRGQAAGEITLRGPVTAQRRSMCDWVNATVKGGNPFRRVTITVEPLDPKEPPRKIVFFDAFLTGYRLPPLTKSPCADPPFEEVSFAFGSYSAGA